MQNLIFGIFIFSCILVSVGYFCLRIHIHNNPIYPRPKREKK